MNSGPDLSRLAKLGIRTSDDLLLHLPLRYEDETRVTPIRALVVGAHAQVEGEVLRSDVQYKGRKSLVATLSDGSGEVDLRFLNFYGSQIKQFTPGNRVRALGEVRGGLFGLEFVHPRCRVVRADTPLPDRLTPVYPTAQGISQLALRTAISQALLVPHIPDTVAAQWLPLAGDGPSRLPSIDQALRLLHGPTTSESIPALLERSHPAWLRVIFDELLAQQLSLRRARAERSRLAAMPLTEDRLVQAFEAGLPFRLTQAQQRAWMQIGADLGRYQPMNRLLQGDVGSGKTVVAALAALRAIGSGAQAALMAPTEILASQHRNKLERMLTEVGVRIGWLVGSVKGREKRRVREALLAGEIDLAIGTHALIEEEVQFARLGLVIVDEQHRFGVAQRLALRQRQRAGDPTSEIPHQLMMSATPIPRTLAMSYYADLDVSVIDELPPGRSPILTKLVSSGRRDEVIERIRAEAEKGRQVYWVCPLIEESEALDLQNALDTHEGLSAELAPLTVGLLHGRMNASDKQAVMSEFIANRVQVLVSTTVIEVGVDVSNATLMVIEHAERFGLAQLHQLRGRVGRGAHRSVCVLLYHPPLSPTARERLKVMFESTDGFEIARRDLLLRGPGEFLGARQSGTALLRFADLERDAPLVDAAQRVADLMLAESPKAVDAHLARWLSGREEFLKA